VVAPSCNIKIQLMNFHKIIKQYSIICLEHIKASKIGRNVVRIDVIKGASDVGDAKQNMFVLN
jgi:hypothetical protein